MLAPWKKTDVKSSEHIKKQRYHFADKGPYSQSYGFSSSHVRMWELNHKEGWVPKIDAFELWCWKRLLRVPWTARRSNESVLKKSTLNINCKDWCWSWNSNTLAIWCKELSHLERSWCWERLKKGGQQRIRLLDGIIDTMDMSLSKPWEMVKDGEARRAVVHDVTKSQMWLSDWTTYTCICMYL